MVSPGEWGPHAWRLLHGVAGRVGKHQSMLSLRDEQNELRLVLRNFSALMPCQKCQKHYREWLRKSPPEVFLSQYGEMLQISLQDWLYELHEAVNTKNEVTSGIQRDQVPELYREVNLRYEMAQLRNVYQRGIQSGVLKSEEWKVAYKHLDLLLRFVGV